MEAVVTRNLQAAAADIPIAARQARATAVQRLNSRRIAIDEIGSLLKQLRSISPRLQACSLGVAISRTRLSCPLELCGANGDGREAA